VSMIESILLFRLILYARLERLHSDKDSSFDALQTFEDLLPTCYRVTDKSLARPGRKKATATEDFDVHISFL
jgi:hypothetical protein